MKNLILVLSVLVLGACAGGDGNKTLPTPSFAKIWTSTATTSSIDLSASSQVGVSSNQPYLAQVKRNGTDCLCQAVNRQGINYGDGLIVNLSCGQSVAVCAAQSGNVSISFNDLSGVTTVCHADNTCETYQ